MRPAEPTRVAILGGGAGALSAAFELTSRPGHERRFAVTVYTNGWRLGGKGASGRNRHKGDRIEEHGLHLWLGCYENAFRTMRRCYEELGRAPTQPLATWEQAFTPWPVSGVMEQVGGAWLPWIGHFRRNDAVPGQGEAFLSPVDLIAQGIEILRRLFATVPPTLGDEAATPIGGRAFGLLARAARLPDGDAGARLLGAALRIARFGLPGERSRLPALVDAARAQLWKRIGPQVAQSTVLRRLWITADLTATVIRGLVVDDVARRGFDPLDRWDLVEWLLRHGASPITADCAFVRGMYDFAFADHARRTPEETIAAGAMIRLMLRMMFNYRGSMFYRMEGGMGDVVFAPLYEVLRRRGVRFELFHEVQRLRLSADGRAVDAIDVDRQARVRPGIDDYAPLVDVGGVPCWPSEPLHDQLERGDQLAAGRHNLEAQGHGFPPAERRVLRRGQDFDLVVLGIALGALPPICGELSERSAAWRAMFAHVPTVATQSLQLWLREDPRALGWSGDPAVVDAFAQPFNTYADMGHVLAHERWGAGGPRGLAYLCGPLASDDAAEVRPNAERWLDDHAHVLWPRAGSAGRFDHEALFDPEGRRGAARLDAQYLRANVAPSDRYVRAPRGSTEHRLHPARSGFDNLTLAGDWTWTGMNLGNVEAAITSGMLAARAIAGHPERIAWTDDGIARAAGGAPQREGDTA